LSINSRTGVCFLIHSEKQKRFLFCFSLTHFENKNRRGGLSYSSPSVWRADWYTDFIHTTYNRVRRLPCGRLSPDGFVWKILLVKVKAYQMSSGPAKLSCWSLLLKLFQQQERQSVFQAPDHSSPGYGVSTTLYLHSYGSQLLMLSNQHLLLLHPCSHYLRPPFRPVV